MQASNFRCLSNQNWYCAQWWIKRKYVKMWWTIESFKNHWIKEFRKHLEKLFEHVLIPVFYLWYLISRSLRDQSSIFEFMIMFFWDSSFVHDQLLFCFKIHNAFNYDIHFWLRLVIYLLCSNRQSYLHTSAFSMIIYSISQTYQ